MFFMLFCVASCVLNASKDASYYNTEQFEMFRTGNGKDFKFISQSERIDTTPIWVCSM